MSDRFRISSQLAGRLADEGVSLDAVLARAELPPGFFQQERIWARTDELFALWQAIGEVSADPGIGLRLGTEARVERHDPTAIAALCSRSFRDALQRMARYKELTCPEKIRIRPGGGECRVEFDWLLARGAEPLVLTDLCLAWILGIARRGLGVRLTPLRVELARAPEQRELLEEHFGCRVHFRARGNALVFRETDLDRPFVTHNADLLALLGAQLEAELQEHHARPSLQEHVKAALKRRLAGERPTLQSVARDLGVSARTLQRRLTGLGATFQRLLEESRQELARHYLAHSSLELNETAYLLGYEDANSFFRAFQGWEGTSPGAWRTQRRATSSTPA